MDLFLKSMGRSIRSITSSSRYLTLLLIGVFLSLNFLGACQKAPIKSDESDANTSQEENRLIVKDAILEQSDAQGKILWRLQADTADYSQDSKAGVMTGLLGNLYENGEVILSLKADRGRVVNDGEHIFLEENLLATDNRNGVVLKADQAEWQPQNQLLLIDDQLDAKYPNGNLTALKGRYAIDRQELELNEEVEAIAIDPPLRLQSDQVFWSITEEKISGDQGLTLQRYDEKKILAQLQSKAGEVLLAERRVTVSGNVILNNLDPEAQFTSNEATWDLPSDTITSEKAVQITQYKDKVQFRGNRGSFNLKTQEATMVGNVTGQSDRQKATLKANQVNWNLNTQNIVAQGKVEYEQRKPRLRFTGNQATGKLGSDQLIVTGTRNQPVVTEVIP